MDQALAISGFIQGEGRERIARNKSIVDGLIENNKKNLSTFITTANLYSGGDPLTLTKSQRTQIAMSAMGSTVGLYPQRAKEQLESYETSYTAAKDAVIVKQAIDCLVSLSSELALQLAAADAAEAQAISTAHTFRLSTASGAAQLSVAAGSVAMTQGSALTLEAAIQAGIQA